MEFILRSNTYTCAPEKFSTCACVVPKRMQNCVSVRMCIDFRFPEKVWFRGSSAVLGMVPVQVSQSNGTNTVIRGAGKPSCRDGKPREKRRRRSLKREGEAASSHGCSFEVERERGGGTVGQVVRYLQKSVSIQPRTSPQKI